MAMAVTLTLTMTIDKLDPETYSSLVYRVGIIKVDYFQCLHLQNCLKAHLVTKVVDKVLSSPAACLKLQNSPTSTNHLKQPRKP